MKDYEKYKNFIQNLAYIYPTLDETQKREFGEYLLYTAKRKINPKTTLIRLHKLFQQSFNITTKKYKKVYERNKRIYEDSYFQKLYKERKLDEETN